MPSSFHEGSFKLILAKKISQQGTINGTGKGKRRKEKKETLEKKPTNYMQLINVLMWEMIYLFVSKVIFLVCPVVFYLSSQKSRVSQ